MWKKSWQWCIGNWDDEATESMKGGGGWQKDLGHYTLRKRLDSLRSRRFMEAS